MDYVVYAPSKIKEVQTSTINPTLEVPVLITVLTQQTANQQYKFSIFNGIEWKVLKDYSNSNKYEWKPSAPGTYKIKVETKNIHSKAAFDDTRELNFIVPEVKNTEQN
nr:triple tyrosine motif-containing protein [Bacillus suaedaesalsae]